MITQRLCRLSAEGGDVESLLEDGANPNFARSDGKYPLHCATENDHIQTVKCLLNFRAATDSLDANGFSALMYAAANEHVNPNAPLIFQLLLTHGADPNLTNQMGSSCIHLCGALGSVKCMEILLREGVNPSRVGWGYLSALHLAADRGDEHTISLLLSSGADPLVIDAVGWTPLHWAAARGHTHAAIALILKRPNPPFEDSNFPSSLIHTYLDCKSLSPIDLAYIFNHYALARLLEARCVGEELGTRGIQQVLEEVPEGEDGSPSARSHLSERGGVSGVHLEWDIENGLHENGGNGEESEQNSKKNEQKNQKIEEKNAKTQEKCIQNGEQNGEENGEKNGEQNEENGETKGEQNGEKKEKKGTTEWKNKSMETVLEYDVLHTKKIGLIQKMLVFLLKAIMSIIAILTYTYKLQVVFLPHPNSNVRIITYSSLLLPALFLTLFAHPHPTNLFKVVFQIVVRVLRRGGVTQREDENEKIGGNRICLGNSWIGVVLGAICATFACIFVFGVNLVFIFLFGGVLASSCVARSLWLLNASGSLFRAREKHKIPLNCVGRRELGRDFLESGKCHNVDVHLFPIFASFEYFFAEKKFFFKYYRHSSSRFILEGEGVTTELRDHFYISRRSVSYQICRTGKKVSEQNWDELDVLEPPPEDEGIADPNEWKFEGTSGGLFVDAMRPWRGDSVGGSGEKVDCPIIFNDENNAAHIQILPPPSESNCSNIRTGRNSQPSVSRLSDLGLIGRVLQSNSHSNVVQDTAKGNNAMDLLFNPNANRRVGTHLESGLRHSPIGSNMDNSTHNYHTYLQNPSHGIYLTNKTTPRNLRNDTENPILLRSFGEIASIAPSSKKTSRHPFWGEKSESNFSRKKSIFSRKSIAPSIATRPGFSSAVLQKMRKNAQKTIKNNPTQKTNSKPTQKLQIKLQTKNFKKSNQPRKQKTTIHKLIFKWFYNMLNQRYTTLGQQWDLYRKITGTNSPTQIPTSSSSPDTTSPSHTDVAKIETVSADFFAPQESARKTDVQNFQDNAKNSEARKIEKNEKKSEENEKKSTKNQTTKDQTITQITNDDPMKLFQDCKVRDDTFENQLKLIDDSQNANKLDLLFQSPLAARPPEPCQMAGEYIHIIENKPQYLQERDFNIWLGEFERLTDYLNDLFSGNGKWCTTEGEWDKETYLSFVTRGTSKRYPLLYGSSDRLGQRDATVIHEKEPLDMGASSLLPPLVYYDPSTEIPSLAGRSKHAGDEHTKNLQQSRARNHLIGTDSTDICSELTPDLGKEDSITSMMPNHASSNPNHDVSHLLPANDSTIAPPLGAVQQIKHTNRCVPLTEILKSLMRVYCVMELIFGSCVFFLAHTQEFTLPEPTSRRLDLINSAPHLFEPEIAVQNISTAPFPELDNAHFFLRQEERLEQRSTEKHREWKDSQQHLRRLAPTTNITGIYEQLKWCTGENKLFLWENSVFESKTFLDSNATCWPFASFNIQSQLPVSSPNGKNEVFLENIVFTMACWFTILQAASLIFAFCFSLESLFYPHKL